MLAEFVLASLIQRCTASVGSTTIRAIVELESSSRPYAIHDNTMRHAYFPERYAEAVELATALSERGHDIDVGYMQVNITSIRAAGLDLSRALEPCTNLRLGADLLRDDYARAERRWGPGQAALARALSAYNSGGYERADYARAVYHCAARLARPNAPWTPDR
jgi:type IV secretion system protein VirB1